MSKVLFNKRKPGSTYFPVTHEILFSGTGHSRSTDAQNMRFEEINCSKRPLYTKITHTPKPGSAVSYVSSLKALGEWV